MQYNALPGEIYYIYVWASETPLSAVEFDQRAWVSRIQINTPGFLPYIQYFPSTHPRGVIEAPAAGAVVQGTVIFSGWAVDAASWDGPGMNRVEFYLGNTLLGQSLYGFSRPDVAWLMSDSRFLPSGFTFLLDTTRLPNGLNTITVRFRSSVTGLWSYLERTINVNNGTSPNPTTPTVVPSASPTVAPSASPTVAPSASPTVAPSASPTVAPRASPTVAPRASPTVVPRIPTITLGAYSVNGRVIDPHNRGVAGVTVSAGGRSATTDTTGAYRISGLPAGNYQLTASHSGYSFSPSSHNAIVAGDVQGQNFVATPLTTSDAFDLTISLYNNPQGNQRRPYEEIIGYFADAVFEMSNGVHKVGTVTIYPNNGRHGRADVRWVASCRPSAAISGYGFDGPHIEMCDEFSQINFLLEDHEGGGYILAHEWGHYFYALYDEYRKSSGACDPGDPGDPCPNDTPVQESIMNNSLRARGGHFAWLNFSTALNNTRNTAQHRVYQASGWETLVRSPALDPRDGVLHNYPARPYFPALVDVAPAAGQAPRIDLVAGHTARSELNIVWTANTANLSDEDDGFVANLNVLDGGIVSYPNPIRLLATLQRTRMVAGALAQGELLAPDGSYTTFTLRDDGLAPDPTADDGIYAALVNYTQDGPHTLRVYFSNPNGNAKEVFDSGQFAPPPPGVDAPQLPAPIPISDDFAVIAEMVIIVSGTQADDHGDTPQSATLLEHNNHDLVGKIDRAGDRDLFRIEATQAGRVVVRVSDLAFGMLPRLRILAADGTTERANVTWSGIGYLWAEVSVEEGGTIYAEVSHTDSSAATGIYKISAGAAISSDVSNSVNVYLPLIRR
ncbi:carboxypeptidase regulatory-like domain-containing protein [Candidatus Viridilinea mediisalina]|uniref:carboxypeptidase regulatory-like domain-containing protein n=1 Tax=Candidatus Viridilinea mediisalina TaxID=2024553 RepID=UPI000F59C36A|nr:carboxypeptidase regulatory-like domain-containing protein [Candidatus Viridilinea mediisalina]